MEKMTMKAILPADTRSNGKNFDCDKETIRRMVVVGKLGGKLRNVCEARFYMGRANSASTVYCSLWVHGDNYTSGHGKASGYGYHKSSAALASAINSAGIDLMGANYAYVKDDTRINFKSRAYIGGCGDSSMEMAMKAIARAAGARGELLIV